MNAHEIPRTSAGSQQRRVALRRPLLLVATDGSPSSQAAYAAAELIAEQFGARVHVLSVIEPIPPVIPPPGTALVMPSVDRYREDAIRTDMVEQLLKVGRLSQWTTEIRAGKAAAVIAEVARDRHVDMIIIGTNHHGIVDRVLGGETAANLVRLVDRPVLIASPRMTRLPKRVIIAFELGHFDRTKLVANLVTLGSPESISVVHVAAQSIALGIDWAEFDSEYRSEIERGFAEVSEALRALPHAQPELVVLHGEIAREISQFSTSVTAELVVLGVKARNPASLARAGGTAMKIARAVNCSVLLVPRPA
jgi:nucleotide-binding universal stress UspA family protein